jgi:hypothetical protein
MGTTNTETTTTYYCYSVEPGGETVVEIEAESAEDAAAEYVEPYDPGETTYWVDVRVSRDPSLEDEARHKIAVDPPAPACAEGHEHDWRAPFEVVGGIRENPGVWGHAGGVRITEVCYHCGAYRDTDTWATDPSDGTQGHASTRYRSADEESERYVARHTPVTLADALAEVEHPVLQWISHVGERRLIAVIEDVTELPDGWLEALGCPDEDGDWEVDNENLTDERGNTGWLCLLDNKGEYKRQLDELETAAAV